MKNLLVFIFLTTAGIESYALTCSAVLGNRISEDTVLSVATRAEDLVASLSELYGTHPQMAYTVSQVIDNLIRGIEESLAFDPLEIDRFITFRNYIQIIEADSLIFIENLHSIRLERSTAVIQHEVTWLDILENPLLIEPETNYVIDRVDGSQITVLFSQKVVSKVIMSSDQFLKTVVLQSLKSLVMNGSNSTGLIRLIADRSIFEIKFNGKGGNFRFFAYNYEGVYHIVHWSKDSKHNAGTVRRSIEATTRARLNRGH